LAVGKRLKIGVSSLGSDALTIGAAMLDNALWCNEMKAKLSASIMCADPMNLQRDLLLLRDQSVEYLHCDVMDGHFVPNIMMGTELVRAVKAQDILPLDIHLMVEYPERMISWFAMGKDDIVSIQYESTPNVQRALSMIRERGALPAMALNPATPLECVREVLPDIELLLIMTANPGYAGQKLIEHTLDKISRVRAMLDEAGFQHIPIEVDGNCSFANMPRMKRSGASIFVVGSSSVFDPDLGIVKGVLKARECLDF
jgi:ribulose-phosphate 3-epimerase